MSNDTLAAPELGAIEVQGVTRQSFIMKGALAAGTVYGLGAVQPFVKAVSYTHLTLPTTPYV